METPVSIFMGRADAIRGLRVFSGQAHFVVSVAFGQDGQVLASGSDDGSIRLWDVQTGERIHTLSGHTSIVYGVAFSPDGQVLASCSRDLSVWLWG